MKNSKKILSVLFILLLVVSACGKLSNNRNTKPGPTPTQNTTNLEEPVQHILKLPELKIAQRVCSALKSKSKLLKETLASSSSKEISYEFASELKKDCATTSISKFKLINQIVLSSKDLEFSSKDNSIFFRDVITENTAALSAICNEVLNTDTSLETKLVSNATVLTDRVYLVALSTNSDGIDTVQVNTKIANAKTGGFDALDTQLISVITNANQDSGADARNIGVEKERSQYVSCNGKQTLMLKETFARSYFTN